MLGNWILKYRLLESDDDDSRIVHKSFSFNFVATAANLLEIWLYLIMVAYEQCRIVLPHCSHAFSEQLIHICHHLPDDTQRSFILREPFCRHALHSVQNFHCLRNTISPGLNTVFLPFCCLNALQLVFPCAPGLLYFLLAIYVVLGRWFQVPDNIFNW